MIETTIKDYLANKIDVPILLEHRTKEPEKFIIIEKIGGSKRNLMNSTTFAFQSYAGSMYEASKLNEILKNTVENMIELDEISFVKLNSDYNFTDTDTKRYRYQAVFDIKY